MFTKEQKPPFSGFSASVPWGLFKSIWCFFGVLLGRQGSRSCGYFNAKMRGSRRTAKSDRSKPAPTCDLCSRYQHYAHGPAPPLLNRPAAAARPPPPAKAPGVAAMLMGVTTHGRAAFFHQIMIDVQACSPLPKLCSWTSPTASKPALTLVVVMAWASPASIFGFDGAQEGPFSAALGNGFSRRCPTKQVFQFFEALPLLLFLSFCFW